MEHKTIRRITALSIIAVVFLLSIFLIRTAIDAMDPSTDDPEDYSAVFQSLQRPGTSVLPLFPDEIPEEAEDVYFSYTSDFGGDRMFLKYEMDLVAVQAYQRAAARRATWAGSPTHPDANSMGVYDSSLCVFDYAENGLPSDFTVYVLYQKPYLPRDYPHHWNHGEVSLVGISLDSCELLFMFEDW